MRKLAIALTLTTLLFSCSIAQEHGKPSEQAPRQKTTLITDAADNHLEPQKCGIIIV